MATGQLSLYWKQIACSTVIDHTDGTMSFANSGGYTVNYKGDCAGKPYQEFLFTANDDTNPIRIDIIGNTTEQANVRNPMPPRING